MNPRLSIIIPCYQQAHYLAQAVESARTQAVRESEIIIVNDGSKDNTAEVAETLRAGDPVRIRVIRQENRGLSMARQAGLDAARGEFLIFLDADDWLDAGMAGAGLAAFARRPEAAGAVGETMMAVENDPAKNRRLKPHAGVGWPDVLSSNPFSAIHSIVFKTAAVRRVGGAGIPDCRACEDWDLIARMIRAGMRFEVVPRLAAYYRQRAGAMTRDPRLMLDEKLKMFRRFMGKYPMETASADHPLPLFPLDLAKRLADGAVFAALGEAVGQGMDADFFTTLLARLEPPIPAAGERWLIDRFTYGLQHASLGAATGSASSRASAEALMKDWADWTALNAVPQSRLICERLAKEMRWVMAHPTRRWSLRRRWKRIVGSLRGAVGERKAES